MSVEVWCGFCDQPMRDTAYRRRPPQNPMVAPSPPDPERLRPVFPTQTAFECKQCGFVAWLQAAAA